MKRVKRRRSSQARVPRIPHPAIDWNSERKVDRGLIDGDKHDTVRMAKATCPKCGKTRDVAASVVMALIRSNKFTGLCQGCSKSRRRNLPLLDHPAVSWDDVVMADRGGRYARKCVRVTCPLCNTDRLCHVDRVADAVFRGSFTGKCRKCIQKSFNAKELPGGRRLHNSGYISIRQCGVDAESLAIFNAMKRCGHVAEHRFVMAKHLGRPLKSYELVDHMDGNKDNNALSNLRIYLRGKNMPGSHSGYGTYYDEWQRALAEVARLREELHEWKTDNAA